MNRINNYEVQKFHLKSSVNGPNKFVHAVDKNYLQWGNRLYNTGTKSTANLIFKAIAFICSGRTY